MARRPAGTSSDILGTSWDVCTVCVECVAVVGGGHLGTTSMGQRWRDASGSVTAGASDGMLVGLGGLGWALFVAHAKRDAAGTCSGGKGSSVSARADLFIAHGCAISVTISARV